MRMPAPLQSKLNEFTYGRRVVPVTGRCVAMVLHDRATAHPRGAGHYPFLSRFYNQNRKVLALPESVRVQGGAKGTVKLNDMYYNFLRERNTRIGPDGTSDTRAWKYVSRPDSGFRNKGDARTFEQVTWGGAFVVVDEVFNDRAYIESYDLSVSPYDYPYDYLQRMSAVANDDSVVYPDPDPVFSFLIAWPGERLYMDLADLTFFRELLA